MLVYMWEYHCSRAEMQKEEVKVYVCHCVLTRGLRRQAWADGPQRCYHTVSGHHDWCIATSKKVEHLAADLQSELIGLPFSLFSCSERADGWFGQNKHSLSLNSSTFPPWRKACAGETSSSSLRGGLHAGAVGGGWVHAAEATHRVTVTLGWRRSDPEPVPRGLW